MFQSALLYLQQDFAKQRYIRSNAMILPHVLSVWQQSTRACQFLQYSFSAEFWPGRTGISACPFQLKKYNLPKTQQTQVGRLIQNLDLKKPGSTHPEFYKPMQELWRNNRPSYTVVQIPT